MNTILLIGAGKSSTCLIDYLIQACKKHRWELIIADNDYEVAAMKAGNREGVSAAGLDVNNREARARLIHRADIVVSLLPAALHLLVAKDCIIYRKHLLTASYLDDGIRGLEKEIHEHGLIFIGEMGLDPGIDHMSAMQLISTIHEKGGIITSFKSHCGGLIAPESDDNPWHYKISWNPANIVNAGKSGALFKENNEVMEMAYEALFHDCEEVEVPPIGRFSFYPNRDSLSYIPVYGLQHASTFIRTTLRHPVFCKGWDSIVKAGLTDNTRLSNTEGITFKDWSAAILPYVTEYNSDLYTFIGLFDEQLVPGVLKTSAEILQYLLETRLALKPGDKDMIVMLHEIEYTISGIQHAIRSSLIVKGDDHIRTAMAKTVGLPLGIAASLILQGKIQLTGLHIPIIPEIYTPVMKELANQGIVFEETELI